MSLLQEITTILTGLSLPSQAIVYTSTPPSQYAVLTPLSDAFFYSNDEPDHEIEEVRIVLYSTSNYRSMAKQIMKKCVENGLTITAHNYINYENDTGYYQYAIDVASESKWEDIQ